jgi:hypothetical protein
VGNYFLRIGKWQAISILAYTIPSTLIPGHGDWRIEGGYGAFGGPNRNHPARYSSANPSKDFMFFRLRYEF